MDYGIVLQLVLSGISNIREIRKVTWLDLLPSHVILQAVYNKEIYVNWTCYELNKSSNESENYLQTSGTRLQQFWIQFEIIETMLQIRDRHFHGISSVSQVHREHVGPAVSANQQAERNRLRGRLSGRDTTFCVIFTMLEEHSSWLDIHSMMQSGARNNTFSKAIFCSWAEKMWE